MNPTITTVWLMLLCTTDGFILPKNFSRTASNKTHEDQIAVTSNDDYYLFDTIRSKRTKQIFLTTRNESESSNVALNILVENDTNIDDFDDMLFDTSENDTFNILNNNSIAIKNSTDQFALNLTANFSSIEKVINLTDFEKSSVGVQMSSSAAIEAQKMTLIEILNRSMNTDRKKDHTTSYTFTNPDNSTNERINVSLSVNNINFLNNSSTAKYVADKFDELDDDAIIAKTSYYQQWEDKFKNLGYDKNVRPYNGIKPVEVIVSLHVIRLHSISESTMDFGIDIYYRENWTDPRLAYNQSEYGSEYLNIPSSAVDLIWFPDTYFSNAIRAETEHPGSVTHRSLIRLYPSGTVYYIRKISLTADCPMDISLYPFDKQGCKLVVCSYSYLKKDLFYSWRDGDPIDFQEGLRLPEFQILKHKSLYVDEPYYIGTYSTLHLCLVFKRSAGFCIMQVFFPATAVVMSSWVSLWMEEETQFNDVLGVILAIIFLAYAYNSVMPRVSYVKLLDLFLAACFLFVFLSLSKLVVLKYCRKHFTRKYSTNNSDRSPINVFDQIVLADAESSAIGSSDDEVDSENNTKKTIQNNHNNNTKKIMQNNIHHKPVSFDKAKKMLQRRVTMAKIELENNQRKLIAQKRFLRYLRIFHVVTQLALPIGFATFFVFILIIYPNWPRPEPC